MEERKNGKLGRDQAMTVEAGISEVQGAVALDYLVPPREGIVVIHYMVTNFIV